jgi:hypothetical protein
LSSVGFSFCQGRRIFLFIIIVPFSNGTCE